MLDPALPWVQKLQKECDINAKLSKVKISPILWLENTGIVRTRASQGQQGRIAGKEKKPHLEIGKHLKKMKRKPGRVGNTSELPFKMF